MRARRVLLRLLPTSPRTTQCRAHTRTWCAHSNRRRCASARAPCFAIPPDTCLRRCRSSAVTADLSLLLESTPFFKSPCLSLPLSLLTRPTHTHTHTASRRNFYPTRRGTHPGTLGEARLAYQVRVATFPPVFPRLHRPPHAGVRCHLLQCCCEGQGGSEVVRGGERRGCKGGRESGWCGVGGRGAGRGREVEVSVVEGCCRVGARCGWQSVAVSELGVSEGRG